METMKFPYSFSNMALSGSGSVDEVNSIFSWQNSSPTDFMDHKLALDGAIDNLGSDKLLLDAVPDETEIETKVNLDEWDILSPANLAELKPLPPFTGYTANLSINGIPGHHYHTISQRVPEEENKDSYSNYCEHNIVSSSTCNIGSDSGDEMTRLNFDCMAADCAIKYEECSHESSMGAHGKSESGEYDATTIDDIAAIIGCAIADTTVPNVNNNNNNNNNNNHSKPECDDANASRDSWMDLDAWIDQTCGAQKNSSLNQDGMQDFLVLTTTSDYTKPQTTVEYCTNKMQPMPSGSTLQNLLTHGNMPLLQYRLQNGPPSKQESPSSSNYSNSIMSAPSPPSTNVVSTTENLLLTVNGRFVSNYPIQIMQNNSRKRSPELMGHNLPHGNSSSPSKRPRVRAQKKPQPQQNSPVFPNEQALGLGKEKPVHHCDVCHRGFLNKSNIKVHLRTHTGEKPFSCETCSKAFRQKAHLLKHQQIHKRIGRD